MNLVQLECLKNIKKNYIISKLDNTQNMAIQKYKKYYTLMTEQNNKLFDEFEKINNAFEINNNSRLTATKFHKIGLEVVDIVRFWERKLCAGMERGNNAVYSDKLADKFWKEVKNRFSQIDMVGVKSKKPIN